MHRRRCCSHCSFVASYAPQYPCFSAPAEKAFHPAAMIFTRPISSRLSSWTHCERPGLAVRRTWGGGGAPASLLFTLLIRGQLHTPVPLFQRTRQKGLHPAAMIFTMPIRSRLTSWTNFERSRLAVRPIPRRPWPGSSRSLPCRCPKVGKALLGRLTGFDGDLKAAPLSR